MCTATRGIRTAAATVAMAALLSCCCENWRLWGLHVISLGTKTDKLVTRLLFTIKNTVSEQDHKTIISLFEM